LNTQHVKVILSTQTMPHLSKKSRLFILFSAFL
ncbi:MAG: hypothetical protein ACI892_002240, partial [Marinobacter maritimus]